MGRDVDSETCKSLFITLRKKRPASASPYAENYRAPMDLCQRHLINHRLMVSKLSRRELEDKYINLCDENFSMKKRYQEQEEQIKKLKTKLLRLSSQESIRSKTDQRSNHSKLQDLEVQRQELREKLEALRKSQKKESREKRDGDKVRSQSAHRRPSHRKEEITTRSSASSNNGDEVGYDEDRDEASSVATEDDGDDGEGSCSYGKRNPKSAKACRSCDTLKAEKMANESEFVKMKMNIKFLHKEIQNEKEKNTLLGRQLEEKLSYEIMKRNAVENMEVINLTRQVDDMAKQIQRQQDEQRRILEAELTKQAELEGHIRKEKDKNSELFEECERLKKNIEKIKENMSEVEIERDFLKRQQENFTKIVDENKLLRFQLEELRSHNEDLGRQIETLKEEEAVTKNAQKMLLEKLKTLQQDNDTLSVLLEGLRTENETLVEEKSALEDNLKSLEGTVVTDENQQPEDLPLTPCTPPSPKQIHLSDDSDSRNPRRTSPKQVRISQILPRIALLQQNSLTDSNKPKQSNTALLLSNSYAQNLAKEFRTANYFGQFQTLKTREASYTSASSSSADKKRISFQEDRNSATEDLSSLASKGASEQGNDSVSYKMRQSYAAYFGITPEVQQSTQEYSKSSPSSSPSQSEDHIAIVIRKVRWRTATLAMLLERKVQHFYVEFSFLGERGHRMETPQSADLLATGSDVARQMDGRPPLEYTFDHRVVFELGDRRHERRRQVLQDMMLPGGRDMVRFLVVNEQVEVRNCSELGFAAFRLRQEIQGVDLGDSKMIEAPIYDVKDPVDEMGVLYVLLEGIDLLKSKFCS
ncbi:uncharacterized protein LOC135708667 [Ochlerotatus camptorhynchus]|uniref:uncharacterized protein LOC135708667 n=1 Tax=Ochlerotatus camptorhynchus TaxID=644619 RepID=UPI0031DC4F50